jgi:uncharacterized phage-associated protein
MYSAFEVANFFIATSLKKGKEISPMKLQKLVYFAYGWYLALYKKTLINETIEAWKFGPVIRSLYEEFKIYGNKSITNLYKDPYTSKTPEIKDAQTLEFLEIIWNIYADFSAIQLANHTHESGSPWYLTIEKYLKSQTAIPRNKDIDDDIIDKFFSAKINTLGARQSQ